MRCRIGKICKWRAFFRRMIKPLKFPIIRTVLLPIELARTFSTLAWGQCATHRGYTHEIKYASTTANFSLLGLTLKLLKNQYPFLNQNLDQNEKRIFFSYRIFVGCCDARTPKKRGDSSPDSTQDSLRRLEKTASETRGPQMVPAHSHNPHAPFTAAGKGVRTLNQHNWSGGCSQYWSNGLDVCQETTLLSWNYATNIMKRRVSLLDGQHATYLPCSSAMLVSWLDPSCAMEGQNLTHPSGDTAMQDGVTISEFPPDEKTFTWKVSWIVRQRGWTHGKPYARGRSYLCFALTPNSLLGPSSPPLFTATWGL